MILMQNATVKQGMVFTLHAVSVWRWYIATSDCVIEQKWRNTHVQIAQKWHDEGPHNIAMSSCPHVSGSFHEENLCEYK